MKEYDHLIRELEGFGAEFVAEMNEYLMQKDAHKQKEENNQVWVILSLCIFASVLGYYAYEMKEPAIFLIILPFLIIPFFMQQDINEIDENIKEKIMTGMCSRIGLNYDFKPDDDELIPYRGLSIIPTYTFPMLEDGISGTINGVSFSLLEAKLVQRMGLGYGEGYNKTAFRGILGKFAYPDKFKGATIVTRKRGFNSGLVENFLKVGERVSTGHPGFEAMFEVFTTRSDEVENILSANYMDRILEVSKKLGPKGLQLAFYKGSVYVSIERKKNYFEGGMLVYRNPNYFEHNINDITIIFYIIKELGLSKKTKI